MSAGTSTAPLAIVTVERVYSQVRPKPCAKTSRERRRFPLRQRVLHATRHSHTAAGRHAGLPHHRIYDLRHTYATWSLAARADLFTLSRRMGTSLAMIDATYGLALDADHRERDLLDASDQTSRGAAAQGG